MPGAVVGDKDPSLLNGLLGWWGCHELVGTDRLDSTGRGNTLTETNNTVASAAGLIGLAGSFDTVGSLTNGLGGAVIRGGPFTLACWVRPTNAGTRYFMSQGGAANGIAITMTSTNFRFMLGSGLQFLGGAPAVAWTHVAGTYDGQSLATLYVNGAPVVRGAVQAANYAAATFAVGASGDTQSFGMNGLIQLAGAWGRCLTPGNVASLYNNGQGVDYPFNSAA